MNRHANPEFRAFRQVIFGAAAGLLCALSGWRTTSSDAALLTEQDAGAAVSSSLGEDTRLEPAQVSLAKSRVYVFVDKTGFGHQHGVEGRLRGGSIRLGATEDAGEIVFDMNSFDADTDAARRYVGLEGSTDSSTRRQVNANMKNAAVLSVREFPVATFAVSSAKLLEKRGPNGSRMYELVGTFTLRAKVRPLKVEVEVQQTDGMDHVRGQFSILQTEFGIKPFRKALGAVGVADRLTILGDLWVGVDDAANARR